MHLYVEEETREVKLSNNISERLNGWKPVNERSDERAWMLPDNISGTNRVK